MNFRTIAFKILAHIATSFGGQTIGPLSPEDAQRLENQRDFIAQFLCSDVSRTEYQNATGKLDLLRELLEKKQFQSSQTYELQCMGVVLGDALAQETGMEWAMVEDEHGRDPALRLVGTSIIIYPLTMISKRVEQGETVDIFNLFNGIVNQVDGLRNRADKA